MKYEYTRVGGYPDAIDQYINEAYELGWRLISVVPCSESGTNSARSYYLNAYLERPVEAAVSVPDLYHGELTPEQAEMVAIQMKGLMRDYEAESNEVSDYTQYANKHCKSLGFCATELAGGCSCAKEADVKDKTLHDIFTERLPTLKATYSYWYDTTSKLHKLSVYDDTAKWSISLEDTDYLNLYERANKLLDAL